MSALLSVRHLVKHFRLAHGKGTVYAVNDISFDIAAGETLALVGESGSGKTTVGRCILSLIEPTAGEIMFRADRISGISQRDLRPLRPQMQLVFQEPGDSLDPRKRIGASIGEPLVYHGRLDKLARRERVAELLRMVRLEAKDADKFPHQISDGQQQRVGIARAIATNPDLVILDEPTSNLDISVRGEIIDLLIRLQGELGITYLFISHDLAAVRQISHRVAIMYLGRIVETGRTEDVFERQLHPYGRALLSSVLYPDPRYERSTFVLEGEIPSPINLPEGCALESRCPLAVERCGRDMPALEEVLQGHHASCFRVGEIFEAGDPEKVERLVKSS